MVSPTESHLKVDGIGVENLADLNFSNFVPSCENVIVSRISLTSQAFENSGIMYSVVSTLVGILSYFSTWYLLYLLSFMKLKHRHYGREMQPRLEC